MRTSCLVLFLSVTLWIYGNEATPKIDLKRRVMKYNKLLADNKGINHHCNASLVPAKALWKEIKSKIHLISLSGMSLLIKAVVTSWRFSSTSSQPTKIFVAKDRILLCSSWRWHTKQAHTYVTLLPRFSVTTSLSSNMKGKVHTSFYFYTQQCELLVYRWDSFIFILLSVSMSSNI